MLTTISFHAERLHEDLVWSRLTRVLKALSAHRGFAVTFFVDPLRARVLGIDLTKKLDELVDRGHEVAMHTHFCELVGDPGHTRGFRRPSMLSEDVRRCLDEGFAYLRAVGHRPDGFVAGVWAVSDTAFTWLNERGFTYDCTYRTFLLSYPNPEAARGYGPSTPWHIGNLLELPTTGTLMGRLRGRRRSSATRGPQPYRLLYLHDFDLLDGRKLAASLFLLRAPRRLEMITSAELAARVTPYVAAN